MHRELREHFRRRADRGREIQGSLAELAHLLGEIDKLFGSERDAEDFGQLAKTADRGGDRRNHALERLGDALDAGSGFVMRGAVVAKRARQADDIGFRVGGRADDLLELAAQQAARIAAGADGVDKLLGLGGERPQIALRQRQLRAQVGRVGGDRDRDIIRHD
jgi:hypothetical protein